jgi:hypothetical protein
MAKPFSTRELLSEVKHSIVHTCRPPSVNPRKKVSRLGPQVCVGEFLFSWILALLWCWAFDD